MEKYIQLLFRVYGHEIDGSVSKVWLVLLENEDECIVKTATLRFIKERMFRGVPLPAELFHYIELEKEELARYMQGLQVGTFNMLSEEEQDIILAEGRKNFYKTKGWDMP